MNKQKTLFIYFQIARKISGGSGLILEGITYAIVQSSLQESGDRLSTWHSNQLDMTQFPTDLPDFDAIVFHFDGNNNDLDDIAGLPMA
ncbi:MAG: hypothetical protein AAFN42_21745, partial [Cyanobacteria bacterium J06554_1]